MYRFRLAPPDEMQQQHARHERANSKALALARRFRGGGFGTGNAPGNVNPNRLHREWSTHHRMSSGCRRLSPSLLHRLSLVPLRHPRTRNATRRGVMRGVVTTTISVVTTVTVTVGQQTEAESGVDRRRCGSLSRPPSQHETRRIITPYATRRDVTRGAVAILRS